MPTQTAAERWLDPTQTRLPYWLRAANSGRLGYAIVTVLDAIVEHLWEGIMERFPEFASDEGLAALGRDRRIVRGPSESVTSYRARLIGWREAWRNAGTAVGQLVQTQKFFLPSIAKMRIVSGNSAHARWTTINPDGTREYVRSTSPTVWDWDGEQPFVGPSVVRTTRWWLIIYPPAPYTTSDPAEVPNIERSVGSTLSVQQGIDILQIANSFRMAGATPWGMIVAFDPDSFNPDGSSDYYPTNGKWYRTYIPGSTNPQRDPTARYYGEKIRRPS